MLRRLVSKFFFSHTYMADSVLSWQGKGRSSSHKTISAQIPFVARLAPQAGHRPGSGRSSGRSSGWSSGSGRSSGRSSDRSSGRLSPLGQTRISGQKFHAILPQRVHKNNWQLGLSRAHTRAVSSSSDQPAMLGEIRASKKCGFA